jgi:phage shock protein A
MRRNIARSGIRPKISTMPRQKTEAAFLLDLYKLMVEKKRLQQELQSLDERRRQICDRMAILEQRTAELEQNVQQMRSADNTVSPSSKLPLSKPTSPSGNFDTLFLEY